MASSEHKLTVCRPRPIHRSVCDRHLVEVLSEEELTLLAAFPGVERDGVSPEEAARRTGFPRGRAARVDPRGSGPPHRLATGPGRPRSRVALHPPGVRRVLASARCDPG